MRLLFVLPYGPGTTRVRSRLLLETLGAHHTITLIALMWDATDRAALDEWRARGVEVIAIPHTRSVQLAALRGDPRRPLQQIAATSPTLARVVRERLALAAWHGAAYDAVHVEHLRGAAALDLGAAIGTRVIFDAVDCIAELARLTRHHHPNRAVRLLATIEEAHTRRYEARLLAAADAITVVAARDRDALLRGSLPARITVVPNGVPRAERPVGLPTAPVAIFTGKLSYHANQAALRWLLTAIWPRIRATRPDACLIVAGSEPPAWAERQAGRDGVRIVANPPTMQPLLAAARVALAPLVYSVGIQNKVLEAMAYGLPVVASPTAAAGLLPAAHGCFGSADDTEAFAMQTAALFDDTTRAETLGRSGQEYVRTWHSWTAAARQFEALYAGDVVRATIAPQRRLVEVG